MIVLIGANGSMGRRYQAILRHLCVDFLGFDIEATPEQIYREAEQANGTILATPTATHVEYCRLLAPIGKPLLCEKPLSKNLEEVGELLQNPMLQMMTQYSLLDPGDSRDHSLYDFYHTGSDGLAWDCMQIIGLAKGTVTISNRSPIWMAMLNGHRLSLDKVGRAYVAFVENWLKDPRREFLRYDIYEMHRRAAMWGS